MDKEKFLDRVLTKNPTPRRKYQSAERNSYRGDGLTRLLAPNFEHLTMVISKVEAEWHGEL